MSNQTHTETRKDHAEKRREYLRTKARIIVPAIIAGSVAVLLIGYVLKLALQSKTMSNSQFAAFVLSLVLTLPCTIAMLVCEKKALSIPYVPPVSEPIGHLPAEEILVRASGPPIASPEELLRAAVAAGTDSQDLLRPDQE